MRGLLLWLASAEMPYSDVYVREPWMVRVAQSGLWLPVWEKARGLLNAILELVDPVQELAYEHGAGVVEPQVTP